MQQRPMRRLVSALRCLLPSVVLPLLIPLFIPVLLVMLWLAERSHGPSSAPPHPTTSRHGWAALRPKPSERLLVFAVHPDDELVGAGAYLAAARGPTLIVYLTRGEASYARRLEVSHGSHPRSARERLGRQRTKEARLGLGHLNRRSERPARTLVLPFPDRDLERLLPDAPTAWQPESASRFYGMARRIVAQFRPDVVLLPLVYDRHPDHRAAGALLSLAALGTRARTYGYLVHWPLWPIPGGYTPRLALRPPRALLGSGLTWYRVPITPSERRSLLYALYEHRSQFGLGAPYLLAFLRANGLLAAVSPLGEGVTIYEPSGVAVSLRGRTLVVRVGRRQIAATLRAIVLYPKRRYEALKVTVAKAPLARGVGHLALPPLPRDTPALIFIQGLDRLGQPRWSTSPRLLLPTAGTPGVPRGNARG